MKTHNGLRFIPELIRGVGIIAGLDDSEGGLERLGETLTPIVNPWERDDWAYVIGERWCTGYTATPSAAGTNSAVGLRNPLATSKHNLLVKRSVIGASSVADQYELRVRAESATGVLGVQTVFSRDTRFNPLGNGGSARILQGRDAVKATFGAGPLTYVAAAASDVFVDEAGFVLSPGYELWWIRNTQNQGINVSWSWREIFRYPGQT